MASSRAASLLDQLKRYHMDAERIDYIMPIWLPFIQIILGIIAAFVLLAGALSQSEEGAYASLGVVGLLIVIAAILTLYVVYKWIDRRNKHFERAILFYTTAAELATELGLPRADALHSRVEEMKVRYERRSPIVWAILYSLVPFVSFYVLHFLTKDFREHSLTEKLIYTEFYDAFSKTGRSLRYRPDEYPLTPERNTILYIILSIITGIFLIYWVYVVTKDPNEHFRNHRLIEGELIKAFEDHMQSTTVETL